MCARTQQKCQPTHPCRSNLLLLVDHLGLTEAERVGGEGKEEQKKEREQLDQLWSQEKEREEQEKDKRREEGRWGTKPPAAVLMVCPCVCMSSTRSLLLSLRLHSPFSDSYLRPQLMPPKKLALCLHVCLSWSLFFCVSFCLSFSLPLPLLSFILCMIMPIFSLELLLLHTVASTAVCVCERVRESVPERERSTETPS